MSKPSTPFREKRDDPDSLVSELAEDDDTSSGSDSESVLTAKLMGSTSTRSMMGPMRKIRNKEISFFRSTQSTTILNRKSKFQSVPGSYMNVNHSKSVFSLMSAVEDAAQEEDTVFEQIWGKNKLWAFGRFTREMAKNIHKEHWHAVLDTQGPLPKGVRIRTPSVWVPEEVSVQSAAASTLSLGAGRGPEISKPQPTTQEVCSADNKREILTEIRDDINEEEYLLKEIHPSFSGNNPVLIWTPFDSISPGIRLSSPYEIMVLSFCPHEGNFLVGACSSGHIILWDLTGHAMSKFENVYYSTDPSYLESQRVINSQLKWRRSKSTFKQVYPTAMTSKKDSHSEKVIAIQWIHCDKEFDCKSGRVVARTAGKMSLQFLTVSEDRVMKVWDMRTEPRPAVTLRYPDKGFTKTSAAKKPQNLQKTISKYSELHRRWSSRYTVEPRHDDNSFFFSTCVFSHDYYLNPPDPSDEKREDDKLLQGAFFGTLGGDVGYFTWEGTPFESATTGSLDTMITTVFTSYHDGPVNCLSRHPVFEHICISTGGHVFAIWNLNYLSGPIKWVRYREVLVTACGWSEIRPSIFKVARSDGLLEFWDLLVYSHRPRIDPLCTGNGITMTADLSIPPKQFIAIADVSSSLRMYYTIGHHKPLTDEELDHLGFMLNEEPERRTRLEEWENKWRAEHVAREPFDIRPHKEQHLNQRTSQTRAKDFAQPTSCNPFMAQLYRWYLRRRGDKSVWLDEADKKWFAQEQAHMKTQILANKMWDQKKMDKVMRQLDIKEKRETLRKQRVQEILDQADEIFKAAVADIFIKKEIELKASKISVKLDEPKEFDIQSAVEETQLLFGEDSKKFEEAKLVDVSRFPVKERKMLDVLAKYRQVRMVFNDSRRYRDSKLKWLRNKLRKEVEKYGCELVEWQTKTNTLMKWEKYDRRIKDIEKLRDLYGLYYNPLWDKDKRISKFEKRMAIGNIRVNYTVPKRKKRKKGLDLQNIIGGGDISFIDPKEEIIDVKSRKTIEVSKDQVVERESMTPLFMGIKNRQVQLMKESIDQFAGHLPEIKKSVTFPEESSKEDLTGGVLPLPDIVPRTEQVEEPQEPETGTKPYLETLLVQPIESEGSSESDDFEPDIAVMEIHKDIDNIVDKLSSVYSMLKADVNIKPELHRFKWEPTEEYLVSEEEDEKKSEQAEDDSDDQIEAQSDEIKDDYHDPNQSDDMKEESSDYLLD